MGKLFFEPGPTVKENPTFMAPIDTSGDLDPMRLSQHVPTPKRPARKVSKGSSAFNQMSPIPSHKGMWRGTYRGKGTFSMATLNSVPNPRTFTPTGQEVSRHGAEDPSSKNCT